MELGAPMEQSWEVPWGRAGRFHGAELGGSMEQSWRGLRGVELGGFCGAVRFPAPWEAVSALPPNMWGHSAPSRCPGGAQGLWVPGTEPCGGEGLL